MADGFLFRGNTRCRFESCPVSLVLLNNYGTGGQWNKLEATTQEQA